MLGTVGESTDAKHECDTFFTSLLTLVEDSCYILGKGKEKFGHFFLRLSLPASLASKTFSVEFYLGNSLF